MKIIGRKREQDALLQCIKSKRPEFVVIYGRRRVGKTYLVREFFNNQFSFYATGISDFNNRNQLKSFNESLIRYGLKSSKTPNDWFEAFSALRRLLESESVYRDPINNKRIIFIDEVPWMAKAKSGFKSALDYFWNSWGSAQEDLLLIVCGSATSWIIGNLLNDTKGFHNRATKQIRLNPFSLSECRELFEFNGMTMTNSQVIDSYMVFGGIPYYLNLFDTRLSFDQNVNELCFKDYGELHNEYNNLFYSLFSKPEKHLEIISNLSKSRYGLTRTQLSKNKKIGDGSVLTKDLKELEECGFIRKYYYYKKRSNHCLYQLIDPFTLFSIRFLNNKKISSWNEYINSPSYYAWKGYSFEIVCLNHIRQIKESLGISGIETNEYSFLYNRDDGAQIDLIIDRNDNMINLCEIKYTNDKYNLDSDEYEKIRKRISVFAKETKCLKAIHVTLITGNGYKENKYTDIFQNIVTGDDLFK